METPYTIRSKSWSGHTETFYTLLYASDLTTKLLHSTLPPCRNSNRNSTADVPPPYEQAIAAAAPAPIPAPIPAPELAPDPALAAVPVPAPQPVASKQRVPLPEEIKAVIVRHYIPEFERVVRQHEPADLSSTSAEVGKWKKTNAESILRLIQERKAPFEDINNTLEGVSEKSIREVSVALVP